MPTKRSKTSRLKILSTAGRDAQPMPPSTALGATFGNTKPSGTAPARSMAGANGYLCALERNQNGKYNVRVRAIFAATRGEVDGGRPAQAGQNGLAIVRETEFSMWLPKFEDLARGLLRLQRQPQVRAYLEDFAMTKRQFAQSPR